MTNLPGKIQNHKHKLINSAFIYGAFKRAVVAVALFFFSYGFLHGEGIHKGLWVLREDLADQKRIDQFLKNAKTLGFTDLFVQVRSRGDAMYHSKYVETSPMVGNRDFDPLKYVCSEGHKKGLKIHAWFNTYVLYSNRSEDPPDLHLLSIFPEWIEWDENAVSDLDKLKSSGNHHLFEGVYLSPLHPQVNRYLLVLMKELISEYNIDGLHLDYIRYQGPGFGYNPDGMDAFYKKYGVNPRLFMKDAPLWNDSESYKLFKKLYDQYRRDAINKLLKDLSDFNRQLNIPVVLSAAVKPSPAAAKNDFYQDWAEWLKQGWLDYAIPMNYATRDQVYRENLLEIKDMLPSQYTRQVWIGNGIWNQNYPEFEKQAAIAKSLNFPHYVIFSYNVLKADKVYFSRMKIFNHQD
ncbi:MAG: hypothetical protein DRP86_00770 [Candidatus Neomarinimicrobiota bacterium]|nr:MAG: hypothetical protein DRP86_00770 [Candidatus Neomarinimicrobiota bacterium]